MLVIHATAPERQAAMEALILVATRGGNRLQR
jgi:hypothetical protein